MLSTPSRHLAHPEKNCLVCSRPAVCKNYGVLSCDACKMFFRRTTIEKLPYVCKKNRICFDITPLTKPICRGCRLQKCFELGMEFFPQSLNILEMRNRSYEDFMKVLRDLTAMSANWHLKLLHFYTEDDPSLEDILHGRKVAVMKKAPQQQISYKQWTFFANYILITSFTNFSFVQKLSTVDKIKLFQISAMKTCLLCSAMKAVQDKTDTIRTPDGQDVYPEEFVTVLGIDPLVMKRLCSMLTVRMIELNVTDEEFILLLLIFFCNPALPPLSDDARSILSAEQKTYISALFQLCQMNYQNSAPSRLNDLISLLHIVNKVYQDLQYITMVLQCSVPDFKFHNLAIDILDLSKNMDYLRIKREP